MKVICLASFMSLLLSCGELAPVESENGTSQIGQLRAFTSDDKYSDEEVVYATKICDALRNKETYFDRVMVNSGGELAFDLSVADCGVEESSAQTESFTSAVITSGSSLRLSTDNSNAMKDIVTSSSKIMSDICSGITDKNRYFGSKSIMSWYYLVDDSNSKCSGSDNYCLLVETGYSTDGEDYKILDKEIYNIADSGEQVRGIVSYRSYQTAQRCTGKDTYLKEQTFKGAVSN